MKSAMERERERGINMKHKTHLKRFQTFSNNLYQFLSVLIAKQDAQNTCMEFHSSQSFF